MKVARVGVIMAIAVAMAASTGSASRMASSVLKKQCNSVSTCSKGGIESNPCNIKDLSCPPCMVFDNNGCFEYDQGTKTCPFSGKSHDCSTYWEGDDNASASKDSSSSSKTDTSNGNTASSASKASGGTTGSAGSNTSGTAGNSNSTSSSSSTGDVNASSSTTKDSGTDMSVVFGIVGAAIGVIAVAVIFLALVRRSRAANEDDEQMSETPQAMNKVNTAGPGTATNAASYAAFAQRTNNPTTPTNNVIKYYNDNAMPSPHGGRGMGFNQQQQAQVKTVRPAAASNAPTFFKGPTTSGPAPYTSQAAAAAPVVAIAAPVAEQYQPAQSQRYSSNQSSQQYSAQQYTTQTTTVQAAPPHPQAEPLFTVHTGAEEPQAVRRVSSPRPRRESYEF